MQKLGGKHKRGARGSVEEEEPSTLKRANMAECQEEEAAELVEATNEAINAEGEPSNAELREMLVDIQINTATILRENKTIRSEMTDLKRTIQHQTDDITALKSSLEHITKQYNEVERGLVAARKKIQEQEEEIGELYDLQDKLEQYTRKNSIEIHGVPESAYTETEDVVLKLAEALDVSGNKPIIVKFISHKVKTNLYRARAKLKNVRVSNIFPQCSSSTLVQADRIFLNENLTSYRKKIMNRANEMRRNDELLSVWSMDGSIYVKTSPQGKPVRINELEDLDYL
ncbi:unnamed protein product [Porites lobata]|uniref:Zinc finger DNA binding protein n=1 Tax=Porites lobata TaxID=104759 RepID=A0ABN8Q4T5_9CNID|nr:unnamed protein product [Porites lobata]